MDQIAFDGMRKHLMQDFTHIDHIDLHGNIRQNPKLSGTTHNVFGIQVGVGITLAVRCKGERRVRYHRVPDFWRKEEKLAWLAERKVPWQVITPDAANTWLIPEHADEFSAFVPIAEIFDGQSLGVGTNRDDWVYDFNRERLADKVKRLIKNYNYEVFRLQQEDRPPTDLDSFVNNAPDFIKWTDRLKQSLASQQKLHYSGTLIRSAAYRPFTRNYLYFDPLLVHRRYRQHEIFAEPETENRLLALTGLAPEKPFMVLAAASICDLHLVGAGAGTQCFPLYTYPDPTTRRDNITDAALHRFRTHYANPSISKPDIFHYVYAILHHPAYREKFADNLKRELPRIPLAPDFSAFSSAGAQLASLHIGYEQLDPWPLEWIWNRSESASYQVEKMRLNKDKTALAVNSSLTLAAIPPETFAYRLGNRSALEWVIDQYQVAEDARTGIRSDPNRPDDPEYTVRLVGQVVRVSIETQRIVDTLPPWS